MRANVAGLAPWSATRRSAASKNCSRPVAGSMAQLSRQAGQAQLQIIETRELDPGDVAWFPDVPGDIHSQQGIGEAAWELVYFGRNPNERPRLYFDPDTGRVEERAAI